MRVSALYTKHARALLVLTCGMVRVLSAVAAPPEGVTTTYAFKAPTGWKVELFAAEPQLSNPVAFCIDEKGRVFVAEEYRFNRGTEENRTRPFLLEDDLKIQTLEDRLAMFKKWESKFDGGMSWFSRYSDKVRLLEDRDGDGRADRSTIFADGFTGPLAGLAAGVIARDGDVYLTCIPNLWLLRDQNGDGRADLKKVVQSGFGVNAGFLGHDLHGLVWGPDGKLYFSIGDRGFHVETKDGVVHHGPRSGAVFRCDPAGENFEVIARGLRNPQELAFDAYGNLFAVDNNCDLGDHARLVHVMEGGNSGWNMAYQTMPLPYQTGPWHAERIWHLQNEGQPAWLVPPIGKLGAGPSGFVTYPGVGLNTRYRDHFFYCNFTSNGGVESFAVMPKGGGFDVIDMHPVVTPFLVTDVDFGYDGKMYISEFGRLEWDGSNTAGNIYKVSDPVAIKDPVVAQVTKLFAEGFRQRSIEELSGLLSHPDLRVRQRAQFALAERGDRSISAFEEVARSGKTVVSRLHGIWGLGQVARTYPEAGRIVAGFLGDRDEHVRAQAAKVVGNVKERSAVEKLIRLLKDSDFHVRSEAAIALGKFKDKRSIEPIFAMLRSDDSRDPFLRHAAVMGLTGLGDPDLILSAADDKSSAVRLAIVVGLRRLNDPRIAKFLLDPDLMVATEAARAINDVPIDSGTKALSNQIDRKASGEVEPLLRRAINANFRLGGLAEAKKLASFAADTGRSQLMRMEAVEALGDWAEPSQRDRVNGFWRPLGRRDPAIVKGLLSELADGFLKEKNTQLLTRAIEFGTKLGSQTDPEVMLAIVKDDRAEASLRLSALRRLADRRVAVLDQALQVSMASTTPSIRSEGRKILSQIDPVQAVRSLQVVLDNSTTPMVERQESVKILEALNHPQADALLGDWLARLADGKAPSELEMELIEAARARPSRHVAEVLDKLERSRSKTDVLSSFRASLRGGDATKGQAVFNGNRMAQCTRCHLVNGKGGTAGPDLTKVATRADREFLLQSLVDPDAKISQGFGTVAFALRDGRVITGVLKGETSLAVTVEAPDGRVIQVPLAEVEERSSSKSAMPKMGTILSPREVRDVIEYLSTLK